MSMRPKVRTRVRSSENERISPSAITHRDISDKRDKQIAVNHAICTCILRYNSAIWHPLKTNEIKSLETQHARNVRSATGDMATTKHPHVKPLGQVFADNLVAQFGDEHHADRLRYFPRLLQNGPATLLALIQLVGHAQN